MAVKTRAELKSDADTFLPDNTSGDISPADLRDRVKDLADSAKLAEDLGSAAAESADSFAPASHVSDTNNPHSVTANQVGAATPGKAIAFAMVFGG